ncbi:ZBT25 protein, partial [Polyodon spathula]|nr:ZBT25 protein [Polyodon spathula]
MDVSNHSLALLQQLNIQREFGFLCDCTVAIGNVYFKAHRAVLAAFSNYFKMIFIHQTSECIKIQPTDIQPDVFSYLLHIMYTGMGPKQQVDQSRLQEGIQFLHAFQLYRNISTANQEAALDAVKMSNLYGIQISAQMTAKETRGLKDSQSRGSIKLLFCHHCGERCSSRSSLWEHLHTHVTGSLPLEVPGAIFENNNLGVVQKISEDFDSLEDRPLQSYLAIKNPLLLEQADASSIEEAMRHSQSLALS